MSIATAFKAPIRRIGPAALLLLGATCALAATPTISVSPGALEFGQMDQNMAKTLTLTISNLGDGVLAIGDVEVSCGCTAADPIKDRLEPGESTELNVTFNSERFSGETLKYLTISSNDPFNSSLEIPVHSNVRPVMTIKPKKQAYSFSVTAGEPTERIITFTAVDEPELVMTHRARLRDSKLDVEILPSETGDPKQKRVRVSLKPDAPVGLVREAVILETNVEAWASLSIDFSIQVTAPIRLEPQVHNFRYLQRGQEAKKQFAVFYDEGIDLEILRGEIDLPGFRVESIEPVPGKNRLNVVIVGEPIPVTDPRAKEARGRMLGTLKLFTNQSDYPELTAAVSYLLKI